MKKGFLFGAMLSAFALVGCVDSNESASVEAVRNSKAEEQKALAAMYNAQAAAATTQAQAEAALAQAEAALVQAHAELTQAEAEYQKIKNEYEKDKNNIELQTLLAQAEAAKAAAEQQIQQIKDQMELAVINQQKAIAEAQLALKQALATLKAEDANEFRTYSYAYTNALNEVYNLQNWLADAKKNLELYKINNNLETQLADNGKFVEGQIARYEGYIANNEQDIEDLKKQLPELEAQLKMLSECEECKAGDLTALKIKLNEKIHERKHAYAAYQEKSDGLDDAVNSAQNAMWSQAGQALQKAYEDAETAMLDDEFYNLVNNQRVEIKVGNTTVYYYSGIWNDLGLVSSSGDWETYKKTWEYLVAEAEYVNWLGDTEKVEYKLSTDFGYNSHPYELSASYGSDKSADQIRLAKEQYEKQYERWIKNDEKAIGTAEWNVSVLEEYARRLEGMARRDSVAVDGKACVDSVRLVLPYVGFGDYVWQYGYDSLKIEKCPAFEIQAWEFNYGAYSYSDYFDKASNANTSAVETAEQLENDKRQQAAYKKFVDLVDNSETYAAEYAKKVDAYYAAMAAYVKDFAEATVKRDAFNNDQADEEKNAWWELNKEINALQDAVVAMENNNNAIENLENQIKGINDDIARYEGYIEGYKAAIEEAKANGKVSEERIKLIYENQIATYEAEIKNYEEQIAVKQAVVDMYKAILDSLVAEDAE